MTAPDTFAMLTLRGKMAQQFETPRPWTWGIDGDIPEWLRKDCDRDDQQDEGRDET